MRQKGEVSKYNLPKLVEQDLLNDNFDLDFSYLWDFKDEDAKDVASAMHEGLRVIALNFEWCLHLSPGGLKAIADRTHACKELKTFALNVRECTELHGESVSALLKNLPNSVRDVTIKYHKDADRHDCEQLGGAIQVLLERVPPNRLEGLRLSFRDCIGLNNDALMTVLRGLTKSMFFRKFEVNLSRCDIDDSFLQKLADETLLIGNRCGC